MSAGAERVDVIAVMDAVDGILNAPLAIKTAELRRQQADLREASAAANKLIAAAKSVLTNPDMSTVLGRMEMQRRLRALSEALDLVNPKQ